MYQVNIAGFSTDLEIFKILSNFRKFCNPMYIIKTLINLRGGVATAPSHNCCVDVPPQTIKMQCKTNSYK